MRWMFALLAALLVAGCEGRVDKPWAHRSHHASGADHSRADARRLVLPVVAPLQ